ncbi:MAG: cytochrome c [Dehalococcoidia bacterium]|nr:cytochrome c [Dehalococcoidia bacterium]
MDAVLRSRPWALGALAALVVAITSVALVLADAHAAADAVASWAALVGLVLLAGVPWLVAFLGGATLATEEARALRVRAARLAVGGGIVVIVAAALMPWIAAQRAGEGLGAMLDTRAGLGSVARLALALVATGLYAARVPRRQDVAVRAVAVLAVLTLGLEGHAATEDYALVGALVAAAHALAAVTLAGAVGAVVLVLTVGRPDRTQSELLRAVLPRFTLVTATAAAALASTGVFAAWADTGAWNDLGTAFGVGTILKTALLAIVLTVAWVLASRASRAHQRDASATTGRMQRGMIAAGGILVLVFAISAVLPAIETPRAERQAEERAAGIVTETTDGGVTITSTIAPGDVGPNRLRVELSRDGRPYTGASDVTLRYANLEANLSGTTSPLSPAGPAAWELTDPAILAVSGVYRFTVRVEGADGTATQDLQFETGVDRSASRLNPTTAWWAGIFALAGAGAAMVAANTIGSRKRILRGELIGWTGAAIAAGAFLLWGRGPQAAAFITNPIPATASSLAKGADVYATYCARCHGEEFDGAGVDAAGLPVQPANLVLHFPQHSDGQHFTVISNGRVQSGMPAWSGTLTDEQIWDVINYLRIETEQRAPTLQVP